MTVFYESLSDYLATRAREHGYSTAGLSEALGYGRSYISGIIHGQFKPSQKRCWEIAEFLGDDPNIILSLAGHYKPAPETELLMMLANIADELPRRLQRTLVEYAAFLKTQQPSPAARESRASYRNNTLYIELDSESIELKLPANVADLSLDEIGDIILIALRATPE